MESYQHKVIVSGAEVGAFVELVGETFSLERINGPWSKDTHEETADAFFKFTGKLCTETMNPDRQRVRSGWRKFTPKEREDYWKHRGQNCEHDVFEIGWGGEGNNLARTDVPAAIFDQFDLWEMEIVIYSFDMGYVGNFYYWGESSGQPLRKEGVIFEDTFAAWQQSPLDESEAFWHWVHCNWYETHKEIDELDDARTLWVEEREHCARLSVHFDLPPDARLMSFRDRFPNSELEHKQAPVVLERVNMDATTKVYNFFTLVNPSGQYLVLGQWGRIDGKTLKLKTVGIADDIEEARRMIEAQVKSKTKKGYEVTK